MARIKAIPRQRTHGSYGHFLNHRQAQSHCGRFLYYDTRNSDPEIIKTTRIESLDLIDDTVRVVYDTQSRSEYGPGVGAVVCHPLRSTILFIHGLTNCDQDRPYGMTRRFGAWASFDPMKPSVQISALESRTIESELVDAWESKTSPNPEVKRVCYEDNFEGTGWSALALIPQDGIESAREECWVTNAYDAQAPLRLAMIVRLATNRTDPQWIDEIYVAEFPPEARQWPKMLQGPIESNREHNAEHWGFDVPTGIQLRRLTYSQSAAYPGVAGPRHWLQASCCGRWIYTMMKDSRGTVRVVRLGVADGQLDWISENQESITHPLAIDPQGRQLSYLVGNRLIILDLATGKQTEVQWDTQVFGQIVGAVQFLRNSQGIFWNARPNGSPWLQIWTASLQ